MFGKGGKGWFAGWVFVFFCWISCVCNIFKKSVSQIADGLKIKEILKERKGPE